MMATRVPVSMKLSWLVSRGGDDLKMQARRHLSDAGYVRGVTVQHLADLEGLFRGWSPKSVCGRFLHDGEVDSYAEKPHTDLRLCKQCERRSSRTQE